MEFLKSKEKNVWLVIVSRNGLKGKPNLMKLWHKYVYIREKLKNRNQKIFENHLYSHFLLLDWEYFKFSNFSEKLGLVISGAKYFATKIVGFRVIVNMMVIRRFSRSGSTVWQQLIIWVYIPQISPLLVNIHNAISYFCVFYCSENSLFPTSCRKPLCQ